MALKAAQVFELMAKAVDEVGPQLVPKVKGVIKFDVTGAGFWIVDLKNGNGKVSAATEADKADIVITVRRATLFCVVIFSLRHAVRFWTRGREMYLFGANMRFCVDCACSSRRRTFFS